MTVTVHPTPNCGSARVAEASGDAIVHPIEVLCLGNASQPRFAGVSFRIYGLPIILIKVLGFLNLFLESELPEEK